MRVPGPLESLREERFVELLRDWYAVRLVVHARDRTAPGVELLYAELNRDHGDQFLRVPFYHVPARTAEIESMKYLCLNLGIAWEDFERRVLAAHGRGEL
ncbi:MAG: hypothetical protein L0216_16830 [Planctomycetales bacterium]|nr:hypothetical protein [Planctomycetales bacterium]